MPRACVLLLTLLVSGGRLSAATHTVEIHNGLFSPSTLTIRPGDIVTWVWMAGGHSTTRTDSPESWDSGVIFQIGYEFSRTFQTIGVFDYVCTPHAPFMAGTITVEAAVGDTTTALSSSSNPSPAGQSVTFTATVSGEGGTPTGTVSFFDGASPVCTDVPLTAGSAPCTTSDLSAGTHSMTAAYSGDTVFNASTSPVLSQEVVPPPAMPAGFSASATGTSEVALSWNPVSGATSYEVVRSTMNGPYGALPLTASTSTNDTGLLANTTYLYKVRAIGFGGTSAFSPADPATTIVYTDAVLAGESIRAVHIEELRTGVNAVRAAGGLAPFGFTDQPLTAGTTVKAVHVVELRTALNQARSAIFVGALAYTDPTITAGVTPVRAVHAGELRTGTQ